MKIRSLKYIFFAIMIIVIEIPNTEAKSYLSISIDDGLVNISTYAYPIMSNRGIVATTNVETNNIGTAGYMSLAQIQTLYSNGWEVASHTKTHVHLTDYSNNSAVLEDEINGSKVWLVANGFPIQTFVYPGGLYDSNSTNICSKYYVLCRTSDTQTGKAYNTSDIDSIIGVNYDSQGTYNFTTQQVKDWINQSINNNSWFTLFFHDVNSTGWITTSYAGDQNLTEIADYIKLRSDAGDLEVCTYIDCWYKMKNISNTVTSDTYEKSDTSNFSYSVRQDTLEEIVLNVTGITIINGIVNPSFESYSGYTPSSWTPLAGTINFSVNSTDVKYGLVSANMTMNTSSTQKKIYQNIDLSDVGYSIGDRYYISGWFKNITNTTQANLAVAYYNGGAFISQDSNILNISNWTQITASKTIPATTTRLQIIVQAWTTTGAENTNATMLVDGLMLSKKNNNYQFLNGTTNSTNISLYDGYGYFNVSELKDGESNLFTLYRSSGIFNVSVDGSHAVNITINGTRRLSIKYGFVNDTTITESFSNKTNIEFWRSASINLITSINYSIRSGVSGSVGTMTLTPSGAGVNTNISTWNTTGDYRKVFNLSASASVTVGDLNPNTYYWVSKNANHLDLYKSTASGYISFSDTISSETQYNVDESITVTKDRYYTQACSDILTLETVFFALFGVAIMLIIISGALDVIRGKPISMDFLFGASVVVIIGIIVIETIPFLIELIEC